LPAAPAALLAGADASSEEEEEEEEEEDEDEGTAGFFGAGPASDESLLSDSIGA
jgi:hypothetical protein